MQPRLKDKRARLSERFAAASKRSWEDSQRQIAWQSARSTSRACVSDLSFTFRAGHLRPRYSSSVVSLRWSNCELFGILSFRAALILSASGHATHRHFVYRCHFLVVFLGHPRLAGAASAF